LGWKRTLKVVESNPAAMSRDISTHGAQRLFQLDLECFQGWDIYHLSGQPVPVFHHPHCKKQGILFHQL